MASPSVYYMKRITENSGATRHVLASFLRQPRGGARHRRPYFQCLLLTVGYFQRRAACPWKILQDTGTRISLPKPKKRRHIPTNTQAHESQLAAPRLALAWHSGPRDIQARAVLVLAGFSPSTSSTRAPHPANRHDTRSLTTRAPGSEKLECPQPDRPASM